MQRTTRDRRHIRFARAREMLIPSKGSLGYISLQEDNKYLHSLVNSLLVQNEKLQKTIQEQEEEIVALNAYIGGDVQ